MAAIKYPLEADKNGNLAVVENSISQQILHFCETFKGETIEPDYGLNMYVGESAKNEQIASKIFQDITTEIPGIYFQIKVTVNDTGELEINIYWRENTTEPFNFLQVTQ